MDSLISHENSNFWKGFRLIVYFYARFLSFGMGIEFITSNWIEITGVALSLVYLLFSIKQNIWLWPFGLLSALFYIVIFFQNKFYADMGLQVYYVAISLYGWWNWSEKKAGSTPKNTALVVSHIPPRTIRMVTLIFFVLWAGIYVILYRLTDSELPVGDSFTTAGSIIATWMLAKKYLEHWILWIIIDLVSMLLYIYKGLFPTTILFAVYTAMAATGYVSWRKDLKYKV